LKNCALARPRLSLKSTSPNERESLEAFWYSLGINRSIPIRKDLKPAPGAALKLFSKQPILCNGSVGYGVSQIETIYFMKKIVCLLVLFSCGCFHKQPAPAQLSQEELLQIAFDKKVAVIVHEADNMIIQDSEPLIITRPETNQIYKACYHGDKKKLKSCIKAADQDFSYAVGALYWATDFNVVIMKAQIVSQVDPQRFMSKETNYDFTEFQKNKLGQYIVFEILARQTHNEALAYKAKKILTRYKAELEDDLTNASIKRSLASDSARQSPVYLTLIDDHEASIEALKKKAQR
jgi:hypothetical protein